MKNIFCTAVIIFSLVMSPIAVAAQVASGGNFTLEQSVIASGGGQTATGGNFSLDGTIGQSLAGGALNGSPFVATSGFWNFSPTVANVQGFEGDVASRPDGDGSVLSNDIVQIRRFLNGTHIPDPAVNEFQRADSFPYADKGDGVLNSADVVQTRRYQNGTSLQQTAGGPLQPSGGIPSLADEIEKSEVESKSAKDEPRQLRVESVDGSPGQKVTVNIRVNAQGDEAEYAFILNYDQKKLSKPVIGDGTVGATVRACNRKVAGQINCSIGGFPNNNAKSSDAGIGEIAAGSNQILITITFTIEANAPGGATMLTLSDVNASSDAPQLFTPTATGGTVTILGETAVSVSGRVTTVKMREIRNARLNLTSANGESQTIISGASADLYKIQDLNSYTILSIKEKKL